MSELVEIAILAYRNGRYRDAMELLLQVTDTDANNWLARLYLAMCYEKAGRITEAHRLFKRMTDECPDQHLRNKAENALPLVEAEMRKRFRKELVTGDKKKSDQTSDNIFWVG